MHTEPDRAEHQWLLDAQNGDFEAFRAIVVRYSNSLLSVAYSVLGDFHEAQDVTQEAFTKCYQNLHTLKDPARLGSWLYSIAYRTSLDFAKKKKRTVPYDDLSMQEAEQTHAWMERHAAQDAIWSALQTLEQTSKSALILHDLGDWTMREIGQFLNLSLSAVESRIRRAREKLKRQLAGDFGAYFRAYRAGPEFEQLICENVLRRMGHFYIAVTNRQQSTDWFVRHFHLPISRHGNLQLASGEEVYLLESPKHSPLPMPVLTFAVSGLHDLWMRLTESGVRTEPIQRDGLFGEMFVFCDPDGNKFWAVHDRKK